MASNENEEFEFRLRAEQERSKGAQVQEPAKAEPAVPAVPAAKPSPEDLWSFVTKAPDALGETALTAATGMVAKPLSDVAGLLAIPAYAAGLTPREPAEVKRTVERGLTYEPKTAGGKAAAESAWNPLNILGGAIEEAAKAAERAVGEGTAAGRAAAEAVRQAPAFLGVKGGKAAGKVMGEKAMQKQADLHILELQRQERDAVVKEGKAAGYRFTPSEAGGMGGRALQGMSTMHIPYGEARHSALEKEMILHNANVTDAMARKALGLGEAAPLTKEIFDTYRQKQAAPYNTLEGMQQPMVYTPQYLNSIDDLMGNLSDASRRFKGLISTGEVNAIKRALSEGSHMSTTEAVQAMRYLREQAKENLGPKSTAESAHIGKIQKDAAAAIEKLMDEHLQSTGQGKLMDAFLRARKNLAMSYTVEESMNGGRVSASALAKAQKDGAPLTGELALAAKMAEHHPSIMRDAAKVADKRTDVWADLTLASGAAVMGHPVLAAALAARPAIRKGISSKWYQSRFIGTPKYRARGTTFAKAVEKIGMLGIAAPSAAEQRAERERELKARRASGE